MSRSVRVLWLSAVLVVGCSSKGLQGPPDSGSDHPIVVTDSGSDHTSSPDALANLPPDAYDGCLQTSTAALDTTLELVNWPCKFTQAQARAGIQFPYRLVVYKALTGVHPTGNDGSCAQPDASGFVVSYRISGNNQSYCLCDTGLCAPRTLTTAPTPGIYDGSFTWSGENWTGPSDYGAPKGPAFPPGTYTVSVSASGTIDVDGGIPMPFNANSQTLITITP